MAKMTLVEAYQIVNYFKNVDYPGKIKTLQVQQAEAVIREYEISNEPKAVLTSLTPEQMESENRKLRKRKLKLHSNKINGMIDEVNNDKFLSNEDKKFLNSKFTEIRSYYISLNKKSQ